VNTVIDLSDARTQRALLIAADAGQWMKCRTRDGRKAYGIRSSADAHEVYFVTRTSCTCHDARRHDCKHMRAVQIHCSLVAGQPTITGAGAPIRHGVIPAALIERED
jgi:hypothetical protein